MKVMTIWYLGDEQWVLFFQRDGDLRFYRRNTQQIQRRFPRLLNALWLSRRYKFRPTAINFGIEVIKKEEKDAEI